MPIQIKGLDELIRKLGKAAAVETITPAMQRSVLRLQRRMQEYPPPLRAVSEGGYRRTGTYGRRWTTRVTTSSAGLTGKVGNNTRYGPFVGSQQFQARIHRGRWNTDDRMVKEESPAIVADFQRAIDQALEGK